jgi:hypothetical protein
MSHVPVAWQRPGWNIHISSDISAPWAECHSRYIKTRTYSNAMLCQSFKAIGEELVQTNIYIFIYIDIRDIPRVSTFSDLSFVWRPERSTPSLLYSYFNNYALPWRRSREKLSKTLTKPVFSRGK